MNDLLHKKPFLCFIIIITLSAHAQKKDPSWQGILEGGLRDSVHNAVLLSATLAVYTQEDSRLISYQLSNNFGEFHFTALPIGIPLKLVASYTGYKSVTMNFTIPVQETKMVLQVLNMQRTDNNLPEAIVSALQPPVRMNKDTLEFNADAFKLDSNAQVEDLLRILPGVTVWGDGSITVNGRKVNSLRVNGKPFFSGDIRVATQNIPKNIVDKIQVYQQNKDPERPLDSATEVNIKLKKRMDNGYFGKLSIGYGTHSRYDADGDINYFTPKTQVSLVGSANNVNKMANDAGTLLSNSSYKGTGASIDYQPNFTIPGINQFKSAGLTLEHDFIPDPDFYKNNCLEADYFIKNNTGQLQQTTQTTTFLGGENSQIQQSKQQNNTSDFDQLWNTKYELHKSSNTYSFSSSLNSDISDNKNENIVNTLDSTFHPQSTNNLLDSNHNDLKTLTLEGEMKHGNKYSFPGYEIAYSFKAANDELGREYRTGFVSVPSPDQNQHVDRLYDDDSTDREHHLTFTIGDFNRVIFRRHRLPGITITLQNKLDLISHTANNTIKDKDTLTGLTVLNTYLTNKSHYNSINVLPALVLGKGISKGLMNRYLKTFYVSVDLQSQIFDQRNTSEHSFQSFSHFYQKFQPEAQIKFNNNQYGEHFDNYGLSFSASSVFPNVQQLFPLVDSANQYYIQEGNPRLNEQDNRELIFKFNHSSDKGANILFYSLNVKAGFSRNFLADSSFTDSLGRSIHYTVNADGYRYLNAGASLSKAFKFRQAQIQLTGTSTLTLSRNPGYINNVLNYSDLAITYNKISLYFTYQDWMVANFAQDFNHYESRQKGLQGGNFSNSRQSTELSVSINCTKKFSISSNITYNKSISDNVPPTNFTLWNASASYRLLRGNNAEIKFSALDLLHQNTGIINSGYNNSITSGATNILQQYFMITLTYFPRKFGKKEPAIKNAVP